MAQWFEERRKEWEAKQGLPKRMLLEKHKQELREAQAEVRKPKPAVEPHPDRGVRAADEIWAIYRKTGFVHYVNTSGTSSSRF